jgi:hypothetical protein
MEPPARHTSTPSRALTLRALLTLASLRVLALLSLAATAAGCATPGPVVRLTPKATDATWLAGRGIVTREKAGLRVACAFDRQEEELLAFRVEAQNRSSVPIEMDPRQLAHVVCETSRSCSPAFPVEDPEQHLVAIDAVRARHRAAQKNHRTAGAVLVLLDTTAAVTAAASGNGRAAASFAADALEDGAIAEAAASTHEGAIHSLETSKIAWQDGALRRTTLAPGQGIAGAVYVPVTPGAAEVWIRVDVGERRFWFGFDQTTFGKPPPAPA